MRLSNRKNNRPQQRKRPNKNRRKRTDESSKSDVLLNEVMDKEDREAEIILNDLVPEKDKTKFGIKSNSTIEKKVDLS